MKTFLELKSPVTGSARIHVHVGVGEGRFSGDSDEVLVTHALGSCLGIAVYVPMLRVGALAHLMLPVSVDARRTASESPYLYVDTGLAALLEEFYLRGCCRDALQVFIAGGAAFHGSGDSFRAGQRNIEVARAFFEKNGIRVAAEAVGGALYRTLFLRIADGKAWIKTETGVTPL